MCLNPIWIKLIDDYTGATSVKQTEAPAGLPADLLFFWGKKNKGEKSFY
jgi:hypothetical protein